MLPGEKRYKVIQKIAGLISLFVISNFIGLDIIRAQPPPAIFHQELSLYSAQQKPSPNKNTIPQLSSENKKNIAFLLPQTAIKNKDTLFKKCELHKNLVKNSSFSFFIWQTVLLYNFSEFDARPQLCAQVPHYNFCSQGRAPPVF